MRDRGAISRRTAQQVATEEKALDHTAGLPQALEIRSSAHREKLRLPSHPTNPEAVIQFHPCYQISHLLGSPPL
jgi:hypothetical protein